MRDKAGRSSLRSRLAWFALLYLGGLFAAFAVAAMLHILLRAHL